MHADPERPQPVRCDADERRWLLRLSRDALDAALRGLHPPSVTDEEVPPVLRQPAATFVTLERGGSLCGCVGNLVAEDPLFRSVIINTSGAALRDTRFEPLAVADLPRIRITLSLLSALVPLDFRHPDALPSLLVPGRDGVVLKARGRTATYLPKVWERLADAVAFLESLGRKAGLEPGVWREPGTEVRVYRVQEIGETQPTGAE